MLFRLLLLSFVWNGALLTVTWLTLSVMFLRQSDATFAEEREEHFSELMNLVRLDKAGLLSIRRQLSDPRFSVDLSGYYWQIENARGEILRSPSLGSESLHLSSQELSHDSTQTRIVAGPSGDLVLLEQAFRNSELAQWVRVGIGTDKRYIAALSADFERFTAIAMAVVGSSMIIGTFGLGLIGFLPLVRLRKSVGDARSGLTARIPANFPTELEPVVSSINELIEVNQAHIYRSRVQAGNLAHALKTPLAIALDIASQLHHETKSDEAANLVRQSERMREIIDYHIAKIRSASHSGAIVTSTDIATSVQNVISALSQIHTERTFSVKLSEECPFVKCDREDFDEIIANLLNNAGKWSKSCVCLETRLDHGSVVILIDDDGPGMNAESIEQAFKFGERLDERRPGSGLGLAIVRELVEGYGGRISLGRSPLGGLQAQVILAAAK